MPLMAWRSSAPTLRVSEQLSLDAAEGRFLAFVE
jgi:hypothetical protein